MTYSNDTLCGIFHNQALKNGNATFLMGRYDEEGRPVDTFRSWSWNDARRISLDLARGLIALGARKTDTVAIFSESRPEWIVADQAIQAAGCIEVPLYPSLTTDELAYMVSDSSCSFIIVSTPDKAMMARELELSGRHTFKGIICMQPAGDGILSFSSICEDGRKKIDESEVEKRIDEVTPDDTASIIYTSGTTGRPKGALITQKNWVTNMIQTSSSTLLKRQLQLDNHLLFLVHLPLCHVYGRTSDYHVGALRQAGILAFEDDFSRLADTMTELKPNVIVSIPRFYEKIYDAIHSSISRQGRTTKTLFRWALRQGEKFSGAMSEGRRLNIFDLTLFSIANILVFNSVRKQTGLERLVLAGSGGGKLSRDVCVFIRSMGIQLTEGYGLTETSPVINFNEPEFRGIDTENLSPFMSRMIDWTIDLMVTRQAEGKSPYTHPARAAKLMVAYLSVAYRLQIKPGTVGRTVMWTEEKISESGEILVRGPQVFNGYHNLPEETKEAFTEDGWFRTGDIGRFDDDGYLEITDRLKEIFVTSGGKNIAPHPIELALTARPYIDQACLTGDGRKYITALVIPDLHELRRFARGNNLDATSDRKLLENPKVQKLLKEQVDNVNSGLAGYEQIKYFTVLGTPFSVETGELTPTLKMKRRIIMDKYQSEIDAMYRSSKTTR